MVSPLVMLGIGLAAILAIGTFVSLSGSQVQYAVTAANSAETQNSKVKEAIHVEVNGTKIDLTSNWAKHSRIKEVMVLDKDGKALFQKSSDIQLPAFTSSTIDMSALGFPDVKDKKVLVVTDLGNVFAPELRKNDQNPLQGTGGTGFGNNAYVRTIEREGTVRFGSGVTGDDASLKPHVGVPSGTSFAALLGSNDPSQSLSVPEFGEEYKYVSGSLQQITVNVPNSLSFSAYRVLGGDGFASNGDTVSFSAGGSTIQYGYHCLSHYDPYYSYYHSYCHYGYYGSASGTTIAAKLNMISGQYLLKGSVNSGTLKLVESPYDLTSVKYDSSGISVYQGSASVYTSTQQGYRYQFDSSCSRFWWLYNYCYSWVSNTSTSVYAPVNQLVTSQSSIKAVYEYQSTGYRCNPYWHGYCTPYTVTNSYPLTANGYSSGNFFYITYVSGQTSGSSLPANGVVKIYDTSLGRDLASFKASFEQLLTFPSKQLYLVGQLNAGGSASIKAEKMDPNFGVYFKVTGLPANIPYQIEKNGLIGARGMADQNGSVLLTASSVNIGGSSSPGGLLKVFPSSKAYRGSFSTVVFDTINNQAFNIAGPNEVYVPFAYVRIPFSTDTNLQSISIDGIIALNYLAGQYAAGSGIDVPVLPGMKSITLNTNGSKVVLSMQDVQTRLSAKPILPITSSNSKYSASSVVSSISVDAGREAFAVAGAPGTMSALITVSVSGYAGFTTTSQISPPPHPRDPLSVYVDVYKNGALVKSERIYYDDKPNAQITTSISGFSVTQAIQYNYNQRTATSLVLADVSPGDVVEFYIRTNVSASADPVPIGGITGSIAQATATIQSGSILMSTS